MKIEIEERCEAVPVRSLGSGSFLEYEGEAHVLCYTYVEPKALIRRLADDAAVEKVEADLLVRPLELVEAKFVYKENS